MTSIKNTGLLILICILAGACGRNEEDMIEFESFEVNRVTALTNDSLSPYCHVYLNMQQATEANGHRGELLNTAVMKWLFNDENTTLKQTAESFADNYANSYIKDLLPLYNQDRADTTKMQWYEYHYIINATTQQGTKHTVAYLATLDYYEGGAYSVNQLLTMNFELKTGRQLTLSDIFVTGYEQPLKQFLQQALIEKMNVKNLSALRAKGYLRSMEMFPTENFILGAETITFIYNPYEIAPYELGATELIIPYDDLTKLLKTSFEY